MTQNNKHLFAIILVVLSLVLVIWLYSYSTQPRHFSLQVVNRSTQAVDSVRLFGTGMNQDALLFKLEPQQTSEINTAIKSSGTLKVEVSQGMNRIDTFIVEDTRLLSDLSQRLTIEPNNRFLLGDAE